MEGVPQIKYPPMFKVTGSNVPSEEVNRRLKKVFDELPKLWTDYAYIVLPYSDQAEIDADVLGQI